MAPAWPLSCLWRRRVRSCCRPTRGADLSQPPQEAGAAAIAGSRAALDAKAAEVLDLRAVETANAIAPFLRERQSDLRLISTMPRTPDSYLAFFQTYQRNVWLLEAGQEVRRKEPLYREIAYVDATGQEVLKIVDGQVAGPAELRDVSNPANTTYKVETYFLEARKLAPGEVYVSQSEASNVILMDLSLPVLDGWEATRRLPAAAATGSIPVIGLTAHAMSGDREKVIEAGCDDYDTKPVELPRLLAKMETLLAQAAQR